MRERIGSAGAGGTCQRESEDEEGSGTPIAVDRRKKRPEFCCCSVDVGQDVVLKINSKISGARERTGVGDIWRCGKWGSVS